MKKNFYIVLTSVMLVFCMFLAGCSSAPYTSSYNAVGLVQSYNDVSASMSFSEFAGTMVYELKFNDSFSKSLLYDLRLETGSATIYYDTDGDKIKLASIKSGDILKDQKLKDLTCESMYIIIETDGKCLNGKFEFKEKVL